MKTHSTPYRLQFVVLRASLVVMTLVAICPTASSLIKSEGSLDVTPAEVTLEDRDAGKTVTITTPIANFDFTKLSVSPSSLVTVEKVANTQTLKVKPVDRGLTVSE